MSTPGGEEAIERLKVPLFQVLPPPFIFHMCSRCWGIRRTLCGVGVPVAPLMSSVSRLYAGVLSRAQQPSLCTVSCGVVCLRSAKKAV